jgi:shikimate kinase
MKIFLTGFMGAGKSMVGEQLAGMLNCAFFDLDREVEFLEGCSIQELFDLRGEEQFRRIEGEVLKKLCLSNDSFVLSTGGGTPCYNDQMKYMNEQGLTVYLNVPLDILMERLIHAKDSRPMISNRRGQELKSFIQKLFLSRETCYAKALIEIKSGSEAATELAQRIIEKLGKSSHGT